MKKLIYTIAAVAILGGVGLGWFVNRTPASPFDGEKISGFAADQVQHGEYVARQADCVACHSLPDRKPFSGGLQMGTPMGPIFATNITPDKESGIGNYSLADFDRSIRQGVARDGHRLYPAMPYPSYEKLSDGDVRALYAYFMGGVQAASERNRASGIPWPLNMRWPLALWNAVFTGGGEYVSKRENDDVWNRGAYLVQAAGHCGSCHTPRSLTMNEKALDERSPAYLSGALLDGWYAPSLRQDHNVGLGRWSEGDIFQFLKAGRNQHAVVYGSMSEAYNNSLAFMADGDLRAIARYLKSLPGNPSKDGTPWNYPADARPISLAERQTVAGAQTYEAKCGFCHGSDGKGRKEWIPPLAGASSSLTDQNASQINVTLNGSSRVVTQGMPDSYRMPSFREQLSDQQIAEVLTYVRTSWGNHGGPVRSGDVEALRSHTGPASSSPMVLQMR